MSRVIYNNKKALFFKDLKASVDFYFAENKLRKTGDWRIFLKTIVLVPAAISVYCILIFASYPVWVGLALSILFGLLAAGIGFNIMHDACHGAYSEKIWLNNLLGYSLNALGSTQFFWKQKHNIIHHTYTNVDNVDDDIAKSPIIRMCGSQPWFGVHKIQHLYTPFLYMISSLFWIGIKDFINYFTKTVAGGSMPKMDLQEHVIFWLSKLLYVVFYIVIPITIVGVWPWFWGFMIMHFTLGFTLSIVFQLAHVVEETEFVYATKDSEDVTYIENEWAIHQIKTTANFAPRNQVLSWFVGGLNYQVEHHLFPRISHVHYPAIAKIVEQKCAEHEIKYNSLPTFFGAVNSHFRFLKVLGSRPNIAVA